MAATRRDAGLMPRCGQFASGGCLVPVLAGLGPFQHQGMRGQRGHGLAAPGWPGAGRGQCPDGRALEPGQRLAVAVTAAASWGLISTGEGRARRLGHHIHRPMSRVSAVTSTDLTMTVSMSTPIATVTPISVRITSGRVLSVANVPASMRPAEVMTPPVAPSRVPWRLLSSRTLVIKKML